MTIKQIQLNPVEATAYFWVDTIRNKIREISFESSKNTEKELDFMKMFYNFTDVEWRNLYLELTNFIQYKVDNYVPHGMYGIDDYSQDTAMFYHNDINKFLSSFKNKEVPDIRLAIRDIKDSVIYTNNYGANRWYKSCGITPVNSLFEPNYVLTGDINELQLKKLIMAVITVIKQNNNSFHSIEKLRKIFCDIYIDIYGETDKNILEEQFNTVFNQLHENGLIAGTTFQEEYSCLFTKIDLVGIDDFIKQENVDKLIKVKK